MKLSILLTGLMLLGIIAGCGTDATPTATPVAGTPPTSTAAPAPTATPVPPTATPMVFHSQILTEHWGKATASIEERTFLSDVIVKARLDSAAADVLTFRAITYLKGTGPDRFAVRAETEGRNTQWDNQDGILFLKRLDGQTENFEFTDTTSWDTWKPGQGPTEYTGDLPEGYTVDSRNPVWLPIEGSGSSSQSRGDVTSRQPSADDNRPVITDYDNGTPKTSAQDAVLGAIRWTNIADSTSGGSGSHTRSANSGASSNQFPAEDIRNCLIGTLGALSNDRDVEAHFGRPPDYRHDFRFEIDSGAPTGTVVDEFDQQSYDRGPQTYTDYWEEGRDSDLFETVRTDDDNDASTGYILTVKTERPLPAGEYYFKHYGYPYIERACNASYENNFADTYVTVTAPPGTVHEAFFDPATTTAGVGYLAGTATTTGVLSPAGFSVRGRAITITGLTWHNGRVVLTLDRFGSWLDGFSFIEQDGTVGLRLAEVDATKDWTARTLTWEVSEQPWESGDELMMRMGPIPLPAVRNLTAERDSAGQVVLSWEVAYTAGVNGYKIWRYRPGRDDGPRIYVSDTLSTDTTFTDANSPVPNLTEYSVQAIDRVYNAGESSESVRIGSQ